MVVLLEREIGVKELNVWEIMAWFMISALFDVTIMLDTGTTL